MKPQTAFVVRRIIESFLNKICKSYNVSPDAEAFRSLLLSHIREAYPGQSDEYYIDIYQDFWGSVVEPTKFLDQSSQWEPDEAEAVAAISPQIQPDKPRITTQAPEGKSNGGPELQDINMALDQLKAIGDCLIAIGEAKEYQIFERTLASLGFLIREKADGLETVAEKQSMAPAKER